MLVYRIQNRVSAAEAPSFKNAGPYNIGLTEYVHPDTFLWFQQNGLLKSRNIHRRGVSYQTHPDWSRDVKLKRGLTEKSTLKSPPKNVLKDYHFAFDSLNKLTEWFNSEELARLENNGFYIAVFNVSDKHVILGERQCIFKLEYAEQHMFLMPTEIL